MNTSIKISNHILSGLLQRIGEALGEGEDLILHQSINEDTGNRYVYTEIPGDRKKILETEGNPKIIVNQGDDLEFNEEEIKMLECTKSCPETEDDVDAYYCNFLCSFRNNCNWK